MTVLKDGTVRSTTDAVSAANHDNAEGVFDTLQVKMGGGEQRSARGHEGHVHEHGQQTHEHSHE